VELGERKVKNAIAFAESASGKLRRSKNIIKWPLILACASCALPSILGRRISPALKVLLLIRSGPGDDAA
jgi:hypothetical protein